MPQRYREPLLRAINQVRRDVAVQQLAEDPLPPSPADLERQRNPPGELEDSVIEEWSARFEARAHRGAIDLNEILVRETADQIKVHHTGHRPDVPEPAALVGEARGRLGAAAHQLTRLAPH